MFIFGDFSDSTKVTVKTATGYKNAKAVSGTIVWTVADDGTALYVFVNAKNVNQSSDTKLAVLLDTTPSEVENEDDNTVFTYDVAIDGEETTLSFEVKSRISSATAPISNPTKGMVFAYEMDGEYAKLDSNTTVDNGKLTKVTGSYVAIELNNNVSQYDLPETYYTITLEYEDGTAYNNSDVDTVTVSEGGSLDKDDVVIYTLDGDGSDAEIETLFVVEYVY